MSSISHVVSIFDSWLCLTNPNFVVDIHPTTPIPPCLSSLPAIPTVYLDSHDVVGYATVNTSNKIKG